MNFKHTRLRLPITVSLLAASFTFACAPAAGADDDAALDPSVEAALRVGEQAVIGESLIVGREPASDWAAAEAALLARPVPGVRDPSCATASRGKQDQAIAIRLDGCMTKAGGLRLDGTLIVRVRPDEGRAPRIDLESVPNDASPFLVDGSAVRYTAFVEFSDTYFSTPADFVTSATGTDATGRAFAQTATFRAERDTTGECVNVFGRGSGVHGQSRVDADVRTLTICDRSCPTRGSADVSVGGASSSVQIGVSFDGSHEVKATSPSGTRSRAIRCGDASGS